jgi:transposase-like protein
LALSPEESKVEMTCLTCHNCHVEMAGAGCHGNSRGRRYECQQCGERFSEPREKPFGADVRLAKEKKSRLFAQE